jgi:peroxiredoxin Q/BCP
MSLKKMKKAFLFSLPSTKGDQFDLKKIKENVVIYFYPKDDTPGCTLETKDFSKLYKEFKKNKTEVVGISKDSIASHLKFKQKYKVPFQLLSDEDVKVQKKYKVWGMKSFMGRKFKGTIRSTFLVDKNKKILKSWSNVRVLNHAKEVLEFLKEVK